ncbi:GumC family protein [Tenacibaculum aquimarinum]|uniref:GumC family protein n=1 Tax=Tenacibaculum aquimarinum TaxID=2910675 RepID=UPI001F0B02D8|nr:tyrosine-protein kinase [Tenacibaculum aquimarinum]MCH3882526.1 polysaccharide biosynthesis tyrosine autokinase [Tenacibaculum aquimarinum]
MANKSNFSIEKKTASSNIDLTSYFFKVLSYWKWFLLTTIIAFAIAKYKNDRKIRGYSLDTVVSIKEESNPLFSTGTSLTFNWGGASDLLETIKVILRSRTHNEKVVSRLQFYTQYLVQGEYRLDDAYGKTPFKIKVDTEKPQLYNTLIKVKMLANNKVELSVDYGENFNRVSLINYKKDSVSYFTPTARNYSEEFTLGDKIEKEHLNFTILPSKSGGSSDEYFVQFGSFNGVVGGYRNVNVTDVAKGSSLIRLALSGPNKNRLADYLNTSVNVLSEDKQNQKIAYAVKTKEYIDTLFIAESKSLKDIERELGKYKQQNNIYDLSAEGSKIFEETTTLEREIRGVNDNVTYLNELESYIKSHSTYNSEAIPVPASVEVSDAKITSEIADLIQKSTLRENLRSTVTANHPQVIGLEKEIATSRRVLLENIVTVRGSMQSKLRTNRNRLQTFSGKLRQLPKKEQGLIKFQRNYEISEANYNYLKQKSYEAGTAIAANVSDVKVIDSAKDLGQGPVYPNTQFNYVLALMLGTMLPLFFIILKEVLDNKIHTVEEIQNNYDIPVLGVVGKNMLDTDLAVFTKPKSTVAESFRALRSNIQFLFRNNTESDSSSKTLVLTSSISGEGKTMISINMATVFALSGKKTVLVGLDLRKPKIFGDFGLSNDFGVVNYLINQKSLDEVTHTTQVPNLDVILSGPIPPNPSELLLSNKADEMMVALKEKYDYVVLDTPPVGLVSDALELFKYSDAVIYVIRQNYSEKGMMKMIDEKYTNKEVKNISYVLNDFSVGSSYGYGYGYGYGNGYGYHENDKPKTVFQKIKNKLNL